MFTARYVKRFYEMEHQVKQIPITEHPGEVANLIKVLSNRMDKQGSSPYKACEMAQMIAVSMAFSFQMISCESLSMNSCPCSTDITEMKR